MCAAIFSIIRRRILAFQIASWCAEFAEENFGELIGSIVLQLADHRLGQQMTQKAVLGDRISSPLFFALERLLRDCERKKVQH